jgi:hypothetical protein
MFEHVVPSRPGGSAANVCVTSANREGGLPKLAHVVARFPEYELAIHRGYARDSEFRGLCDDYEEAVTALRYWEAPGKADAVKTEDFRRLTIEIAGDIATFLDASRCGPHPDDR